MTRGRHTFRTGFELNYVARGDENKGYSNGSFSFSTFWTQQLSDRNQNQFDGSGVATLLLGTPTSGLIDYNDSTYRTRPYYGFHVQDDWKVNSRVTVNLGFRYDIQVPWLERYNREARGFDTTTTSPHSDQ